jgi:hypothetical protein
MRTLGQFIAVFASLLAGVLAFAIVDIELSVLGDAFGIGSFVDLDGPSMTTVGGGRFSFDEEIESLTTSYGCFSAGLSFVLAVWVGRVVYFVSWNGGFKRKEWLTFLAWLFAMVALVLLSAAIEIAFRQFHDAIADYLRVFFEVAVIIGVSGVCLHWRKKRIARVPNDD